MDAPALAVFHGHGNHALSRFLKPGFRHCFVAVLAGGYWIVVDGRMGTPELAVVASAGFDLAGFYRAEGFTVVETRVRRRSPATPLMLATCVGAAKRLLGLRAPGLVTPWQLYRHLTAWADPARNREGD